MRLHREDELKTISGVFDSSKDKSTGVLARKDLIPSLALLGHTDPPKNAMNKGGKDAALDFDTFVTVVDMCRADVVARERKKAGFTDQRIDELKEVYNRYDKDKSGEIDTMELLGILKEFGWEPKSRQEQTELMSKLNVARARAREAGIKNVGKDDSSGLEFWTFVQLSRMLETEHEHAEEDRMNKLMAQLKFSQKEVDDFRSVYVDRKKEEAEEKGLDEDNQLAGLTVDAVRRLVKGLGVSITGENKTKLADKLKSLGCDEEGVLDFFGFLDLMRWLMDTNFAGVNETSKAKR